MKIMTFLLGVLGALLFVVASISGGLQIEGYSFISQYISESYASGLPNTTYLRYMFMTSGLMLALFGFMAPFVLPRTKNLKIGFFLFAIFYGLGTISTGFFPCDFGCPSDGYDVSISQIIHNISGFLAYAIVPLGLMGIGWSSKKWKDDSSFSKAVILCGAVACGFVVILFGDPKGPFIGLFQRLIEGSILFWVIYTAVYIRRIK